MIDVSSADEQDVEEEREEGSQPADRNANDGAAKNDGLSPASSGDPLNGVYTQKDPLSCSHWCSWYNGGAGSLTSPSGSDE